MGWQSSFQQLCRQAELGFTIAVVTGNLPCRLSLRLLALSLTLPQKATYCWALLSRVPWHCNLQAEALPNDLSEVAVDALRSEKPRTTR